MEHKQRIMKFTKDEDLMKFRVGNIYKQLLMVMIKMKMQIIKDGYEKQWNIKFKNSVSLIEFYEYPFINIYRTNNNSLKYIIMKFIREASIYYYNMNPSQGYVNSYMELYNSFNDKPTVTKTSKPKQFEDIGLSPELSTQIRKKGGRRRSASIRTSKKSRLLLSNKKNSSKRRKSTKSKKTS